MSRAQASRDLLTGPLPLVAQRLTDRLAQLEARLQADDDAGWAAYVAAAHALAVLLPQLAPERRGALLTTAQMADRLGIAPKTLLKHQARGAIRAAVKRGKLIRWRGTEAIR